MAVESDFLRWLARRIGRARGVLAGPGDDAALVEGSSRIVLKIDTTAEGVHFRSVPPELAGRKALARVLSDFAAAAAVPRYALISAVAPRGFGLANLRRLHFGAGRLARDFGVALVGGDLVVHRGPLVITVAVAGQPGPWGFLRRSGAKPGDRIFVTGPLGGSILGRHLRFRPRIREALAIARRIRPTAMIDISDGLATDLRRLCEASGVGARLESERIPVSTDARRLSRRDGRPALQHALEDGEDYELLYTARRPGGIGVITKERKVTMDGVPLRGGWDPEI